MNSHRRVLIYSPDSYGLGHFRRCLTIGRELAARIQDLSMLCLTGSPRPDLFALPRGLETVKLPSITKSAAGGYESLVQNFEIAQIAQLRISLFDAVVKEFRPDVILVDHAPLGTLGELLPVLERIRERREAFLVLGLRDIIDSPERMHAEWEERGLFQRVPDLYDQVLVYGDPRIFDALAEYRLARLLPGRAHFTGLVCRCVTALPPAPGFDAEQRRGRVLVTTGGGGDGMPMIEDALELLAGWRGPVRVVLGPLSDRAQTERIHRLAAAIPDCTLIRASRGMCRELRDADLVVCMAGYNTAYESVRAARRVALVPRAGSRLEQRLRAARLAALGFAQAVDPEPALRKASLARALAAATPPSASFRPDFRGARRAAALLAAWFADRDAVLAAKGASA